MREIVSDVFTWTQYSEPHGYNFNGHLIRHADGNLSIDPVEPDNGVLDQIAAEGVARILAVGLSFAAFAVPAIWFLGIDGREREYFRSFLHRSSRQ